MFGNSRSAKPADKSVNVWGLAFYAREKWPKRASFFDYDCAPFKRAGKRIIRHDCENGWAEYEVIRKDGPSYDCKLLKSKWRPMTAAELKDAG